MSDCKTDAERLESSLSAIMRGMHRSAGPNPLSHLPLAQLRLLRSLGTCPQTPSALSEQLSTTVSAVTQLANRLEAAKLVVRVEDPNDRRVRRLKLSPRGMRLVKKRKEVRIAGATRLLESIPAKEREEVLQAMERLADAAASAAPPSSDSLVLVAELEGEMTNRAGGGR